MATIALNIATAVVGQLLYSAFAPKPPDQEGPRLEDLNVPAVSPGNPINQLHGTMKIGAQLIWTTGLIETRHEKKVKGGKGGGSKSSTVTTYTYATSLAMAACEGPAVIRRIWANEKLIYVNPLFPAGSQDAALAAYQAERTAYWEDQFLYATFYALGEDEDPYWRQFGTLRYLLPNGTTVASYDLEPSSAFEADWIATKVANEVEEWKQANAYETVEQRYAQIEVFDGTETQSTSAIMEAVEGVGNVPAYRGIAYAVFENLQLADFGNTPPTFRMEVTGQDDRRDDSASEYAPPTVKDLLKIFCEDAGLVETVDFTIDAALDAYTVNGITFSRLTSSREAIEILQALHPFNVIETGGKLVFEDRDQATAGTVSADDYRTRPFGTEPGPFLERRMVPSIELPREINLSYQDPTRDYSKNTVRARRQTTAATQVRAEDLPVAMPVETMKKAAEALLARTIAERKTYKMNLPPKYLRYRAGDIMQIPMANGDQKLARIIEQDVGANFVLETTLVDHVGYEATITAIALDDISGPDLGAWWSAGTIGAVMDIPNLTDENLTNGVYVAFGQQTSGNWAGGALYRNLSSGETTPLFGEDVDPPSGTDWEIQATTNDPAQIGVYTAGLDAGVSPYLVDYKSVLAVQFLTADPDFTSQTYEQAVRSVDNVFLVGNEIIQALDVLDMGDGGWVFSGLLRGLRGTEWAMHSHAYGDQVVHLVDGKLTRWEIARRFTDQTIEYRIAGQNEDVLSKTTRELGFTNVEPLAFPPGITLASRTNDGTLTLEWLPRARYEGAWENDSGASNKDSNDYLLEIMDAPGYDQDYADVIRSVELSDETTYTYTAAEQTSDFGGIQSTIYVRLRQYSADGRLGQPRYETV